MFCFRYSLPKHYVRFGNEDFSSSLFFQQQTRGTTPGSCYLSVFRNETGSKLRKEIDELDPSSCGNLNEAGSQLSQADAPVSPSQDDSSQLGIGPENNDDGRTKGEESAGKKVTFHVGS